MGKSFPTEVQMQFLAMLRNDTSHGAMPVEKVGDLNTAEICQAQGWVDLRRWKAYVNRINPEGLVYHITQLGRAALKEAESGGE